MIGDIDSAGGAQFRDRERGDDQTSGACIDDSTGMAKIQRQHSHNVLAAAASLIAARAVACTPIGASWGIPRGHPRPLLTTTREKCCPKCRCADRAGGGGGLDRDGKLRRGPAPCPPRNSREIVERWRDVSRSSRATPPVLPATKSSAASRVRHPRTRQFGGTLSALRESRLALCSVNKPVTAHVFSQRNGVCPRFVV